jgi:hypothetical protein
MKHDTKVKKIARQNSRSKTTYLAFVNSLAISGDTPEITTMIKISIEIPKDILASQSSDDP